MYNTKKIHPKEEKNGKNSLIARNNNNKKRKSRNVDNFPNYFFFSFGAIFYARFEVSERDGKVYNFNIFVVVADVPQHLYGLLLLLFVS